jgi:hypothetical protein
MPDQSPFKSDYDKDSRQTSRVGKLPTEKPPPTSQTASTTPGIPAVMDLQPYGTGKPYRVVIRGKIST